MTDKKFLLSVIGSAVAVLGCTIGTVLIINKTNANRRDKFLHQTESNLHACFGEANILIHRYDFASAKRTLEKGIAQLASTAASQTDFIVRRKIESMRGTADETLSSVKAREQEYHQRKAAGWVHFDGLFVSPEEKASILKKRKQQEIQNARSQYTSFSYSPEQNQDSVYTDWMKRIGADQKQIDTSVTLDRLDERRARWESRKKDYDLHGGTESEARELERERVDMLKGYLDVVTK